MPRHPLGKFILYPDTPQFEAHDVLIIDSSYREVIEEEIATNKISRPTKCFFVSSDTLRLYPYTIVQYIKHSTNSRAAAVGFNFSPEEVVFFEIWEELINNINAGLPKAIFRSISKIRALKLSFFPALNVGLNCLQAYTELVLVPFLEGSPFYDRDKTQKSKRWFAQSINLLESYKAFLSRLTTAQRELPKESPTLQQIKAITQLSYTRWEHFETQTPEEKCFLLSSYIFGLADLFHKRGQNCLSLLLLHRSLDLYFQSCAFECGIIVETSEGSQYTGAASQEQVNMIKSYYFLIDNGVIAHNAAFKTLVELVNKERNILYLTHNAYGVKESELKSHLSEVEKVLNVIEGDNRWSQVRPDWYPLTSVPKSFLFELEPSMATFLSELTF